MSDRELRDRLEAVQAENSKLRRALDDAALEAERLRALLQAARLEQDRLAALLIAKAVNPEGQSSAFGVEHVARLMAFLKNS